MRQPVGIVLAAGAARRYGGVKQVAPLPTAGAVTDNAGLTLVRHAVQSALAVCSEVRVVLGAHREAVQASLAGLPISTIDNPEWQRGMGASIACAFRALIADQVSRPALLCLCDQPRVDAAALARLISGSDGNDDAIVVSDYGTDGSSPRNTSRGPPCLFPPRLFPELARLDGDQGARQVLAAHVEEVVIVTLPEGLDDIDTAHDYARIVSSRVWR